MPGVYMGCQQDAGEEDAGMKTQGADQVSTNRAAMGDDDALVWLRRGVAIHDHEERHGNSMNDRTYIRPHNDACRYTFARELAALSERGRVEAEYQLARGIRYGARVAA
jgi:hypothetical protein